MENILPEQPAGAGKPARPTFLTVLCILTFIGSGWGIISGITGYLSADATSGITQAAMQDAREQLEDEDNPAANLTEKIFSGTSEMMVPANLKKNAVMGMIASIFTLLGGVLMFKLKKNGYYSYILGTLIGIAAPFVAFGTGNIIAIASSSMVALFGIAFVILYGLNFKHLQ